MSFYTVDNQDKADFFASLTFDDVTATLAAGSDPNERDEDKVTPLHWIASDSEEPAVIETLLVAGADLRARDADGRTPLHWAAISTRVPIWFRLCWRLERTRTHGIAKSTRHFILRPSTTTRRRLYSCTAVPGIGTTDADLLGRGLDETDMLPPRGQ